jgi:hypothetical protein
MKNTIDALKGEMKGISKIYDNVLKQIDKDLMKAQSKGWGATSSFLSEAKPKIEILKQKKTFPQTSLDLKNVDVAIKSKILKAELKTKFPKIPFNVRTSRYSGGSSINVGWTDGVAPSKVRPIVEKYSYDKGSDSMIDYFNVDNYAFAQREISNYEQRVNKLKEQLRKQRQDLANADDWKITQEAQYKLNNMDLPIENLKKQMRGTFK